MMHDTSTFPQFAGLYGQSQLGPFVSPQPYGQQPYGQQAYGQSPFGGQIAGLVPIVTLVPQALLLSLAMQSLQQAQGLGGHQTPQLGFAGPHGVPGGAFGQPQQQFQPQQFGGAFGQPPQFGGPFGQWQQLGGPFGQSPLWGSPWQSIGGQLSHAGGIGRGLLGYQPAPSMSYGG